MAAYPSPHAGALLNGPFTETEVNVYCDESRHEGQSDQPYMVIGGLWLPRAKRREILEGIREVQKAHRIGGELKWQKLSRRCLEGYQAVVDFIAHHPDVHFRCIVVEKAKVDTDKYFQNDRQLGFWVFYWHCLKQWIGNGNTYFISIDFKPASLRSGPRRLKEILENECVRRAWVRSLDCVDSQENLFCQVADLLIGAVGYEENAIRGSAVKLAFCEHVARAFGRKSLRGTDHPSQFKFNVFRIWS